MRDRTDDTDDDERPRTRRAKVVTPVIDDDGPRRGFPRWLVFSLAAGGAAAVVVAVIVVGLVGRGAIKAVQKAANELGTLLAKAYKTKDFATQGAIMSARVRAQGYEHADYVDLVDFCSLLATTLPSAAAVTKKVKDAVAASVFANSAPNPKVKGSHGLSIYLPLAKVSPLYKNLDFGKGGWASFLAARVA